jgi:hypothetical protein
VPDDAAGKRVRCKCGEVLSVPQAMGASTPPGTPMKATSPAAISPTPTPLGPSLFDRLTERDLQQAQANPYAPAPKSANNDAAALKTYFRNDDEKKAKEKSSETNLVLLTIGFFLGAVKNGFGLLAIFLLANLLANAAQIDPLLQAGSVIAVVLVVNLVFDVAVGIGLITRKSWGWWITIIGLAWAAADRAVSAVTSILMLEEEELPRKIGTGIGALIFCIICLSLLNFMTQPEAQKKFKVNVRPALAWGVGMGLAILLTGIAYGIGFAAGMQIGEAIAAPPPAAAPAE